MTNKIEQNIDGDKSKIQWWKIGLCILGVLIIAGAVTYTLMTRASASSGSPAASSPATLATSGATTPTTSGPTLLAANNPTAATGVSPTPSATAANAPASDGTGEMNWIKGLNSKWENSDYIFVVFPGNDDLTGKAAQVVNTSLEKIRQAGGAVDTVTLSSTDPEFQITLNRLAIQKLPAVLVFAVTGQGAVVKGDITETKLLEAYLSLQKTCVPGSGCCGK